MKKNEEKYLYWFEAKDESGNSRKFCILKPTRKMKEDGELFYASKLSQFISAGILPKIVWDKVFKDSGGIISESDQKEYSDLFVEFAEFRNSIDSLSVKQEKTEEDKERISFFESQLVRVRKKMQELEMAQINAFENTAEAKARNRTIVWWAATLSVEEDPVKGAFSLLGNGSIEDKLDIYDSIIENDKFLSDCFSRLNYLITVWYLGSASSFEEFKELDSEYSKKIAEEVSYDEEGSSNQKQELIENKSESQTSSEEQNSVEAANKDT
jgi:hypothetical protein